MPRAKGYSAQEKKDSSNITYLGDIMDKEFAIPHLNKHDKIPNHDGYIDVIDADGISIGEIRVQVKTLKPEKKPKISLEYAFLDYAKSVSDNPVLIFGVDKTREIIFWAFLKPDEIEQQLAHWDALTKKDNSFTYYFNEENDFINTPPYVKWREIIQEHKKIRNGYLRPQSIICLQASDSTSFIQFQSVIKDLKDQFDYFPIHFISNALNASLVIQKRFSHSAFTLTISDDLLFQQIREYFDKAPNDITFQILRNWDIRHLRNGSKEICLLKNIQAQPTSFYRKNFEGNFCDIVKDTNSNDPTTKSFIYYFFSHYQKSRELQLTSWNNNLKKKLIIKQFVNCYNLQRLQNFRWQDFATTISTIKIPDELHTDIQYRRFPESNFTPIIDFIYRDKFLEFFKTNIKKYTDLLVQQFHSALRGGSSTNTNVNQLIWHTHQFLQFNFENNILIHNSQEFKEIIRIFSEGIFASYGVRKPGGSRLEIFDDWIIEVICNNLEPEKIVQYILKFKIDQIELTPGAKTILLEQLLNYPDTITKNISFHKEILTSDVPRHNFFSNKFRRLITFVSFVGLSRNEVHDIFLILTEFIKENGEYLDIKPSAHFCLRNISFISTRSITTIFLASINNPFLNTGTYWDLIVDLYRNKNEKIALSTTQIESLKQFWDEESVHERYPTINHFLIEIHDLLESKELKQKVTKFVTTALSKKFELELFIAATTLEVIAFSPALMQKAIEEASPRFITEGTIQTVQRGEPDERYFKVNSVLNIAFKVNYQFSIDEFEKIRSSNMYYKWIFDMDNFDYGKFDPYWITEINTTFYFQQMKNSRSLEVFLRNFLSKHRLSAHSPILEYYSNIYILQG